MRLIRAGSLIYLFAVTLTLTGFADDRRGERPSLGQTIFRFDTFGDEQLWTDVLRMHEVIADRRSGNGARGRPQGRCRGAAAGDRRARCAPARSI